MGERPSELPADLVELWDVCTAGFALGSHSLHGPRHWRNVYFNGIQLVAESGGAADVTVVRLFAILHDSQRLTEGHDPDHGPRAAIVAAGWRGQYFDLETARMEMLHTACALHDRGQVSADATIGACWDADRLDLPRVGIEPAKSLMSTAAGKRRAR